MNIANLPTINELTTKQKLNKDAEYNPPEFADRERRVNATFQPAKDLSRDRLKQIVTQLDQAKREWRHLGYVDLARLSAVWQMWGKPSLNGGNQTHQYTARLGLMLEEYLGGVPRLGLTLDQVYGDLVNHTQNFIAWKKPNKFTWFQDVEVEYDLIEIGRLVVTISILENGGGYIWDADIEIISAVILGLTGLSREREKAVYIHKPTTMWVSQYI